MGIKKILEDLKSGKVSVDKALLGLKDLPFEDLGFAKVDHHRQLRTGFPEVIYCPGKKIEQIIIIIRKMAARGSNVLATRADLKVYRAVKKKISKVKYNKDARLIYLIKKEVKREGNVAVVTAGTADIPVAEEAALTAELLGANVQRIYDAGVAGVHRLLSHKKNLDKANAIVVVAGMEGALASVVGGLASCPVIAVPTSVGYGACFGGIAPLLSMLNSCAPNVVVSNIDNGFGAGYTAAIINRK